MLVLLLLEVLVCDVDEVGLLIVLPVPAKAVVDVVKVEDEPVPESTILVLLDDGREVNGADEFSSPLLLESSKEAEEVDPVPGGTTMELLATEMDVDE